MAADSTDSTNNPPPATGRSKMARRRGRTGHNLPFATNRSAFTLIELMVVIFIIGIMVVLVVGVGRYVYDEAARRETESTQAAVMTAIEEYYKIQGYYPDDTPIPADPPDIPADIREGMQALVGRLQARDLDEDDLVEKPIKEAIQEACGPIILQLPRDAYTGPTINDGFGNEMRYEPAGGLGGRPVLISTGPDGNFGNEDDIRSDR